MTPGTYREVDQSDTRPEPVGGWGVSEVVVCDGCGIQAATWWQAGWGWCQGCP